MPLQSVRRAFTVAPDGHVYWLAEQDTPVALDADGRRIWDSEGDCCDRMPVLAVGPDGTAYSARLSVPNPGLVARRPDATTLWERAVVCAPLASPSPMTAPCWSSTPGGRPSRVLPRWQRAVVRRHGARRERMAIGADGSAYVVATGVVVAVGPGDGALDLPGGRHSY